MVQNESCQIDWITYITHVIKGSRMEISKIRSVSRDDLLHYLRKGLLMSTYPLSYATRYSLYRRAHDESVAEHCFYVALFVMVLHERYEFDLQAALKMALLHDIPELAVSDVNHKIKREYPEIAKALQRAEGEFIMRKLPQSMVSSYLAFTADDSPEALFVQYADALSVLQWYDNEVMMGNATVSFVYDEVSVRLKTLMDRAESYAR